MAWHAPQPDVSPLVDVLLVLGMVFGLLAYPFAHRLCIDAQLPDLAFADRSADAITIVAASHETVLLDGHPVQPAMLRGRTIIVRADSGAVYQDVVHAVDVALGARARVVRLAP